MKPTEDPNIFRFGSCVHQSPDISLPQLRLWRRLQYTFTSEWAKRTRVSDKDVIPNHSVSSSTITGMEAAPLSLCTTFLLQQVLITQEETIWFSIPFHPSTTFFIYSYYTHIGTYLDLMKCFFILLTVWNVEDQSIASHNFR